MGRARELIRILHADEALVVIAKPPGLAMTPERASPEDPFRREVERLAGGRLFLVHRLDRDTSGLAVLARTAEAHRLLSSAFAGREVEKTYLAVVHGRMPSDEGTIDVPLLVPEGPHDVEPDPAAGVPAETGFATMEAFSGFAFVRFLPRTGRRHQIRVHAAFAGAPIAGDERYGGRPVFLSELKRRYRRKRGEPERPLIARPALHAAALAFAHPLVGERRSFAAELPEDMAILLAMLRKHAGLQGS